MTTKEQTWEALKDTNWNFHKALDAHIAEYGVEAVFVDKDYWPNAYKHYSKYFTYKNISVTFRKKENLVSIFDTHEIDWVNGLAVITERKSEILLQEITTPAQTVINSYTTYTTKGST